MADEEEAGRTFVVNAGSYDGWYCGWIWQPATGSLRQRFGVNDHAGPITAVAACPTWLATGGVDENVRLYSGQLFKSFGSIGHHCETITCLRFAGRYHLAIGDKAGTISCSVSSQRRFDTLGTVKAHRGEVNDVDLRECEPHLVMSVGADKHLKVTNVTSHRTVASRKFADVPTKCRFAPSGETYYVGFEKSVVIYPAKGHEEQPLAEYKSKEIIHCLDYVDDRRIALGCDNKEVRILSISGHVLCTMAKHLNRVRGIAAAYNGDKTYTVASADSEGRLIISHLHRQQPGATEEAQPSAQNAERVGSKRKRKGAPLEVPPKAKVMWRRELKGEFVPYAEDLSALIESAYQAKAPSFELPDTAPARFVLDFATMTQTNHTARPKRARRIQRCEVVADADEEQDVNASLSGAKMQLDVKRMVNSHFRFTCLALTRHWPRKVVSKAVKKRGTQ
jgi:WD40 repeat protein